MSLGLSRTSVRLVPHDTRWFSLYAEAESELRACVGPYVVAIEHIGSTAVPGLDAKPILDIMMSVRSLRLPESFFAALASLGYQHRSQDNIAGRLFFAKGPEEFRTHNLSVCEAESEYWVSHLSFRNLLRSNSDLAMQYASLKHELAARFQDDRRAYTEAKQSFIQKALRLKTHAG